jgi:hypothetical protein
MWNDIIAGAAFLAAKVRDGAPQLATLKNHLHRTACLRDKGKRPLS